MRRSKQEDPKNGRSNAALRMSFEEFLAGNELLGNYDGTLFELRSLMFQLHRYENFEEYSIKIFKFMAKAVNIDSQRINWALYKCIGQSVMSGTTTPKIVDEIIESLEEIVTNFTAKYFSEKVELRTFLDKLRYFQQKVFWSKMNG